MLFLAVFGVGLVAVEWVLPCVFNPWSVAMPGVPALVGYWRGEVAFEPGDRRTVVLELDSFDGVHGIAMDGRAKACGPTAVEYTLNGETGNWSGSEFELYAYRVGEDRGVLLDHLNGTWDKADRLALTVELRVVDDDGAVRSSTPVPPPVRLAMHRAAEDDFDAVC